MVRAMLTERPSAKVMICTENVSCTPKQSRAIREATRDGKLYSDARTDLMLEARGIPDNISDRHRAKLAKAFRSSTQPLIVIEEERLIDGLIIDFDSAKIEVLSEATNTPDADTFSASMFDDLGMAMLIAYNLCDFEMAVDQNKKFVVRLAASALNRDHANAAAISSAIAESLPDEVFVKYGTNHTLLGHLLVRDGHTVQRQFPDKQEKRTLYISPMDAAIRSFEFFPKMVWSDLDWQAALIAQMIFSYQERTGVDNQLALKTAQKIKRELGQDEVNEFAQYFGINDEALALMMDGLIAANVEKPTTT